MSLNCLDCPDEQNYAAIALQLQETALQAEACLYEAETMLRSVTNPETILFSTTSTQTVVTDQLARLGTGLGTVLFSNSARNNVNTATVPWTPGVYEVGAYLSCAPTGVVNTNSLRELSIAVLPESTSNPSVPIVGFSSITMTEPNDGVPVEMAHDTVVTVEAGQEIKFFFRHTNSSSTVQIAAGALYWATRLSDAEALRVV